MKELRNSNNYLINSKKVRIKLPSHVMETAIFDEQVFILGVKGTCIEEHTATTVTTGLKICIKITKMG